MKQSTRTIKIYRHSPTDDAKDPIDWLLAIADRLAGRRYRAELSNTLGTGGSPIAYARTATRCEAKARAILMRTEPIKVIQIPPPD